MNKRYVRDLVDAIDSVFYTEARILMHVDATEVGEIKEFSFLWKLGGDREA